MKRFVWGGNESAYHTHAHDVLVSKNTLLKSLQKSKKFIQRYKPIGFRAPRIYLKTDHLKVLKTHGFKYDSSTYGAFSEKKKIDGVLEFPVTSVGNIPFGSGYFIGALGKNLDVMYKNLNKKNIPVISFIHNWQVLRPKNPTFPTPGYVIAHPHYVPYLFNCSATFEHLIRRFSFGQMKNLIK